MAAHYGGTWEKIEGRFILGASSTYSVGSTGGEATHKLTIDELPSHIHKFNRGSAHYWSGNVVNGYNNTTSIFPGFVENNSSGRPDNYQEKTGCGKYFVQLTGKDKSHNNMPPYRVAYIYKRLT